jgi:putative tryptophan/tyrosine transport system substrate-binding protein
LTVTRQGLTRRRLVRGAGVVGLGLLVGCGRLPGQAPPPPKTHRLGFLSTNDAATEAPGVEAFLQGLVELGYVEGHNLAIEWRYADNQPEQLPQLAAALVHLSVDLIVAVATPAVVAAKAATSTLPIVFPLAGDPVGVGLVASLAWPGGNVTGLANYASELNEKRMELLKEIVPGLARVAYLWMPSVPAEVSSKQHADAAAQALGLDLLAFPVESADDLDGAFAAIGRARADVLMMAPNPVVNSQRARIVEFAARSRLPAAYPDTRFATVGGLMCYGANAAALYRRAAYYVDRILNGTKPADLPIEQPTMFEFVINLKTAQALGLTIPQHVLLQATQVIQ